MADEPGRTDAADDQPDPDEPAAATPPPADDQPDPDEPAAATPPRAASGWRARRRARKSRPRRKAPWWELPALVVLAILIAILVKTFLVQPFYIPSQSMEKTLHGCPGCSGDRILVSKLTYDFRDPEPGDIVVFNAPNGWNDEAPSTPPHNPVVRTIRGFGQLIGFVPPDGLVLVKRVIAVGGQTVEGDEQGNVYISTHGPNGKFHKLDEGYKYETNRDPQAKFGPLTVPKGRLWVMGDHRDMSADSRYHCLPSGEQASTGICPDVREATVPVDDVIGKAVVIAWPPSRWRTLGTPATFDDAAALGGSGLLPAVGVFPLFVVLRRRRRRHR